VSLLAAYIALGVVVGFVAGLLGVGGGLIIVPVLIALFQLYAIGAGIEPHLALGTSLASILFTSISSMRAHHQHGAVEWSLVRRIAPGIIGGTLLGAVLAARMSPQVLKLFFTLFLFYAATQMWLDFKPRPHRNLPNASGTTFAGGVIGAVSSWVGIGGGTLSVPFMLWHNVPLHRAIATSSAIGLPIAIAGAFGYAISGWNLASLPEYSVGFVYLPALAGIVAGSIFTAPLGARTAHRLPVRPLKKIFALLLYALAIRMAWSSLGGLNFAQTLLLRFNYDS